MGYIGVMGSRRTHEKRLVRLAAEGVTDTADLARLRSPIGHDVGARTPEETAVAVCAEIIADRSGRDGRALHRTHGPIHPPPTASASASASASTDDTTTRPVPSDP